MKLSTSYGLDIKKFRIYFKLPRNQRPHRLEA